MPVFQCIGDIYKYCQTSSFIIMVCFTVINEDDLILCLSTRTHIMYGTHSEYMKRTQSCCML